MTERPKTAVNPQQRAAIQHKTGPLLIVAGAGTGKTTVITERIAWLILEKKIPTDGVLALTFTDKAANEMEERVDRLLPYGYVNLWVSTFHAFCERILRAHAIEIGLPADFRLLSQSEQWLLIRRNFDRFNLNYYRPLGNPTRFISSLLKHFSRLEDEDIAPEEYVAHARSLALDHDQERPTKSRRKRADRDSDDVALSEAQRALEVAEAYAVYRQLLLDESSLDFGTLITWTLKLFQRRPAILKKYRDQFQYLLVDEFQDTNWAQYELIKLLAAPRNNLTVVGDDDQSIYKFRGASISNILEFRRDFPEAAQVVLTENYRSRQNILDLAYAFIQKNNPNRLEAALQATSRTTGKRPKKTGAVPTISKKLTAANRDPGLVEFLHSATQEEEVRRVTETIVELKKRDQLEWKDFAILVRANDQAEAFLHSLELAGIPYQFVASKGLYRDPDVLNMTAYLRLLDNYHESPALFRILNLPHFGINPDDVVELSAHARRKGLSLYQAMVQSRAVPGLSAAGRKGFDDVLHLIKQGTAFHRQHRVTETLVEFLKQAGILAELGKADAANVQRRVNVMTKFLAEIQSFEKQHPQTSVRDFLDVFQLKLDSGDAGSLAGAVEPDADGVRVMTVHGAKGLEFEYVFIVQLVDKRFPTIERTDPIEIPEALIRETLPEGDIHLEEERRLLYVAMTRAKRGLYLTAAEDYGGVRAKKPSRFLYELGFIQNPAEGQGPSLARLERSPRVHQPSPDVKYLGTKFSFSALRSYEKCPWQFRYAYVLKVPVGGNIQLSYGESLHTALQKFFELAMERRGRVQSGLFGGSEPASGSDLPVTLDELLELFDRHFVDEWYQDERQRQTYRQRGRAALTKFYERHAAGLPDVFGVEQTFNWKIDQYTIGGKIDRLDRAGQSSDTGQPRLGIVDYKSGRARDMDTVDKYQLFIYALAVQDPNILNARVDSLTYYFMEESEAVAVPVGEKDLQKTEAWIRASIEKIRSGNFDPTPGQVCKYCDYKEICEYRDPNV